MKITDLCILPLTKEKPLDVIKAFRAVEFGILLQCRDGRLYHTRKGMYIYTSGHFNMADLMRIAKATGVFTAQDVRKHAAEASNRAKRNQRREAAERLTRLAASLKISLTADQKKALAA